MRWLGLAVNKTVIESFFPPAYAPPSNILAYDLEFTYYIEEFKGLRGKKVEKNNFNDQC